MKVLIISTLSFIFLECLGQQGSKKYLFDGSLGAAYSQFRVGGFNTSNYPTLELRLGGSVTRNLGHRWAISSGMNFAFKFKRDSYVFNGNSYSGKGHLNRNIDETASQRNHHAVEVPLIVKFYHNDRLTFNAGLMGRFWGPTDLNSDILRSQNEMGFIIGGSREFSKKIGIGVDLYSTIIPVLAFGTRNQFAQLKVIYHFDIQKAKSD